jgi:hypothetical protein
MTKKDRLAYNLYRETQFENDIGKLLWKF